MICSATCKRWGKNWLIYSERFLQTSWLLFMIRLDSHSFFPSYVFLTVCAWANTCGQRMKEWHSDSVSEIHRERVLSKTFLPGLCDFTYSVLNPVKPSAVDESFIRCHGWLGHLGDCEWRTEADHRVHRERNYDGAVFSCSDVDVRRKDRKRLEEDTVQ